MTFCLAPPFDSDSWKAFLESLPELFRSPPESVDILHDGRNRIIRTRHAGVPVAIKRFSNNGLGKMLIYRFRKGKARKSYDHSLRLLQAGLDTPEPIGWMEFHRGRMLTESYYLCRFISFDHDGLALADPDLPDRLGKAEYAGRCIGRLHEAGILPLDLNGGNLLFENHADGSRRIQFIDTNRMRFGRVALSRGVRTLLTVGMEGPLLESFLKGYSAVRREPLSRCESLYHRALRPYKLKWRIKNATRPYRRRIGL